MVVHLVRSQAIDKVDSTSFSEIDACDSRGEAANMRFIPEFLSVRFDAFSGAFLKAIGLGSVSVLCSGCSGL